MNTIELNEYYFQGTRWIPSYRDFDYDDITIVAATKAEAWRELNRLTKYWKGVALTHINGKKITPIGA